MIVIKDISLNLVKAIDEEIGHDWRDGQLTKGTWSNDVIVKLGEAVILKAYDDGTLTLDIGGKKAIISSESYWEVMIS